MLDETFPAGSSLRPPLGRLAPSPTGGLHVGHARTFLIAWWAARTQGARVVLRIEDLDPTRVRHEAKKEMIDDLHWLGIDWDEGPDIGGPHAPYAQSERVGLYHRALTRLQELNSVYPCTCTRADIERALSAPHAEDEGPVYPGICAQRTAGDADALRALGQPFAWRFRVPLVSVSWEDRVLGLVTRNPSTLGGDFVVARENPRAAAARNTTSTAMIMYAYQMAVIADDASMGITQVVRGDDLVASTPRQIQIARALGLPIPSYAHVPLVVGPDGRRLAKRDNSIKLASLRAAGHDPSRLVGIIARSCGLSERAEESTASRWIDHFTFDKIGRDVWMYEYQK